MTAAKERGTETETKVVRYLVSHGWVNAERRAQRGKLDAGDVTGIPGVCIEIKGERANRPGLWQRETIVEARNAKADFFMLVVRKEYKRVDRWDAYVPAHLAITDFYPENIDLQEEWGWVRMELQLAVKLMKVAGY